MFNNIKESWANSSSSIKNVIIIYSILLIILLIFFIPSRKIVLYESEFKNPETNKPVEVTPCTYELSSRQCRIFKEEFITEEVVTTTVSKKKGSTTCCLTTATGGEVSEQCFKVPFDLPRCPSIYIKK